MQGGAFRKLMDSDAGVVSDDCFLKLQMAGEVDSPVVADFPNIGIEWLSLHHFLFPSKH